MARRAVFLDRDGVINRVIFRHGKLSAPFKLQEFEILPGVPEAVAELKKAGFLCVVVTNQPGIAELGLTLDDLNSIHAFLKQQVAVDAIYVCPHGPNEICGCKKPFPGMIAQAIKDFGPIYLGQSFVVGDRWRDMDLARNIGCRSVLVVSEATKFENKIVTADFTANNLQEAAKYITHSGV